MSIRHLVTLLIGFVALTQTLLILYLGLHWLVVVTSVVVAVLLLMLCVTAKGWATRPISPTTVAIAFVVSLGIFVLGGEGRFFYANTDWQVRNAILRDLVVQPWPWVYSTEDGLQLLRCPLAMYLIPATIGKAVGERGAELALLIQNAVLLAAIIGLASTLYETVRERLLTLILVIGFSGLDIVGQALFGRPIIAHAEGWAGLQYTAPLTLAFWVPLHMLAGWAGAIFFLLWRRGDLPAIALLAYAPLGILLSPLAMIGVVPFVLWAGLESLVRQRLNARDVVVAILALLLAGPSLLYLAAGAGNVGAGTNALNYVIYAAFYLLELVPFIVILWLARGQWKFDRWTLLLVVVMLLLIPIGRIGSSTDFVMRASIAPLAILALAVVDVIVTRPAINQGTRQAARIVALTVFAIGVAVPIGEIARAILLPHAPQMLCGYFGVVPEGAATYTTPVETLSPLVRPIHPNIVSPDFPTECWQGSWPDAATIGRG